jgi:hypothetical protein
MYSSSNIFEIACSCLAILGLGILDMSAAFFRPERRFALLILSHSPVCLSTITRSRERTRFRDARTKPTTTQIRDRAMAGSGANQSHQVVTLNGAADLSAPLAGLVICCTSVPDEKRVSSL